jgi:hypothetical protein
LAIKVENHKSQPVLVVAILLPFFLSFLQGICFSPGRAVAFLPRKQPAQHPGMQPRARRPTNLRGIISQKRTIQTNPKSNQNQIHPTGTEVCKKTRKNAVFHTSQHPQIRHKPLAFNGLHRKLRPTHPFLPQNAHFSCQTRPQKLNFSGRVAQVSFFFLEQR